MSGYRAEIHWEVEADTKKQERLHMAMATGVLWVKLDKDSSTQSRTMEDWPVAWSVWNTWKVRSRWTGSEPAPSSPLRDAIWIVKFLRIQTESTTFLLG